MRLSTKARYAARAMTELAVRSGRDPVKLKDIAESQDISIKYLEQLMHPLRVSGFVKTLKGSRGGYTLSRAAEDITLYDIVYAVEGSLAPVDCVDDARVCKRAEKCVTRNIWVNLHRVIVDELQKVTLKEMAEKQVELQ